MNKQYTLKQVIEFSIDILNNIQVPISTPAATMKQISEPIRQVIENLNACVEAIDKKDTEIKEEEADG